MVCLTSQHTGRHSLLLSPHNHVNSAKSEGTRSNRKACQDDDELRIRFGWIIQTIKIIACTKDRIHPNLTIFSPLLSISRLWCRGDGFPTLYRARTKIPRSQTVLSSNMSLRKKADVRFGFGSIMIFIAISTMNVITKISASSSPASTEKHHHPHHARRRDHHKRWLRRYFFAMGCLIAIKLIKASKRCNHI